MAKNTLKGDLNFQNVFKKGKKFGNRHFQFYYVKNRKNANRLGIIVSKKVSKKAVVRNRIKRRIREAYRLNESRFRTGYDMIIIAKKRCAEDSYQDLSRSLNHLFYKTQMEVKKG